MFAVEPERGQLLEIFARSCSAAASLGCSIVMSPVDKERGDLIQAGASVREVGEIAAQHGVRLALEFNSQAAQFNSLESVREVLALAAHPACGLLLDTYHLQRSGRGGRGFAEVAPEEIAYVQYSDVPREGLRPGYALDRLPPGEPRLILADEPTGQLDHEIGAVVVDELIGAAERCGAALVVATHDTEMADRLGETWRLRSGRLEKSAREEAWSL